MVKPACAALFLATVILFALHYMSPSLFRTWFFSSDEYVFAAEAIRFGHGDFRQHFFDMPGTPFIGLTTAAWQAFYVSHAITGQVDAAAGSVPFTFHHLPSLFILMRAMTLLFYGVSIVLTFWIATRLIGTAAGYAAALILAMSPIYTSYSSFVRVESMAMCLVLAGMLLIAYAHDDDRALKPIFFAGIAAGIAAATRLHSLTASVPVLTMMLALRHRGSGSADYPAWVRVIGCASLCAGVVSAGLLFSYRAHFVDWPHAFRLLEDAIACGTGVIVIAFLLHASGRTRPWLIRTLNSQAVMLWVGFACGLIAGVPTVITQHDYLFRSMEMYSVSYVDFDRAGLSLAANLQRYIVQYVSILTPDRVVFVLFLVGAIWIMVKRDRLMLPVLVGCAAFFVSKPLNLLAQPHHVILWLPFYALVAAYPVGAVTRSLMRRPIWSAFVSVATVTTIALLITPGPKLVQGAGAMVEERLGNVLTATDWLKHHTSPDVTVAVSYFCFNPDVFYAWLHELDVPVDPSVEDGRKYMIWWGHASALRGKTGYACLTEADRPSIKKRIDEVSPGEGTDPFTDPRFQRIQSFGTGPGKVFLFRFDYR